MNYETAVEIFADMRKGDESLRLEVVRAAIRYSQMRVEWSLGDAQLRRDMDRARTAAHDALIATVNALSRSMGNAGLDNEWRNRMGQDRRDIGDFGCFLVAYLGILAR